MKKVEWHIYQGEILDADYMNNKDIESEETDADFDLPEVEITGRNNINTMIDPSEIITHTGDVLYIGMEDDPTGHRFIKFVVKAENGLVWLLLPSQIRYINL